MDAVEWLRSFVTGSRRGLYPRATNSSTRSPGVRRAKPKYPPVTGYHASGEPSGIRRNASNSSRLCVAALSTVPATEDVAGAGSSFTVVVRPGSTCTSAWAVNAGLSSTPR
jgi:hypothetical protein